MNIVKAGAEGLIWVVVGIFWVIAQIAGAAAQKKRITQQPPGDDEERELPVDPIAELLRKMTGVQEFELPHPEEREEPEFIEAIEEHPWKAGDIEKLPEMEPLLGKGGMYPAPTPDIEPLRREPPAPALKPVEVAGIAIRPTMKAFRNTLPAMKLPAMTLRFQPLEKSGAKVPNLANVINPADKRTLRRAMLSHIIFSPPKALEHQ